MIEKLNTPIAIIIAGALIAGALLITRANDSLPIEPSFANAQKILHPVTSNDYVRGSREAQVFLIEFSDLECPFCKNFHETLKEVMSEYDEGEIAWVYRHAPLAQLHPKAPYEALASACAGELGGNDVFWSFIDKIFSVTPANNRLDLSLLPQFAQELGIDKDVFQTCLEKGDLQDMIIQQLENGIATAAALGINFGTPFSVVVDTKGNLYPLRGAENKESVKATLEKALK